MIGDEPDDMSIIFKDLQSYRNLFTNPVVAPDQSRLPYLLSLPFLKAFGTQTVQPYIILRYLFLSFHVGFLYLSYRLALLFTGKLSAALGYVMLLLASCYLSAFSIFFLTTSDSLFLLTHVVVLYTFYNSWQDQRSSDFFPRHVTLAVMLGLCVASKLFGLFIAVSLVLFHLVYSNGLKPFSVRGLSPGRLVSVGFLFILLLVIINISPVADAHKLIAVVMLAAAYILYIGIGLFEGKSKFSFVPGRNTQIITLGKWKFGFIICQEVLFPELLRESVQDGANILISSGNDGVFSNPVVARINVNASRLRAIETGRFMVRAMKSGISAIINPSGRFVTHSEIGDNKILVNLVGTIEETTLYTRWGNWLIGLCLVFGGFISIRIINHLQYLRIQTV